MKRWAVTALTLATGITAGTVQAAAAEPPSEAVKEAVKTLWQDQHKALDAHDVEGVMATYADRDDIMLMGTGPGEHWVGKAEIKDAYAHFMENFDPNTMEVKCGEGAGSAQGEVLWLTAVCHFSDKQKDQTRQFVTNLSAVLLKEGDGWRFHTMHFSHLTDGDQGQSQEVSQ
jgi:uncharacterized protein (TIGR02246 family)